MNQFPAAITSDVTLWIRYIDGQSGDNINARCVLHGCFWDDDSSSIFYKTGQQVKNSVSLYIPLRKEVTGRRFVPAEEWAKMSYNELTECWTFNMRQLPLIVKGDNPFEFVQGTAGAVATQENQFLAENPSVRRAKDFNLQDFGSVALRHAVIRA